MPVCTPDGYFAKLQQSAEDATYFCSDREGHPIESFHGIPQNSTQGKKMNCECALARKYLDPASRKPICCDNGNYVAKQCVAGFCYCVNHYGQQITAEKDQILDIECDDFC